MKYRDGAASPIVWAPSTLVGLRRSNSSSGAASGIQMPDRSGRPLTRGALARRFGLPLIRGVPGDGWFNHWACVHTEAAASTASIENNRFRMLLLVIRSLS